MRNEPTCECIVDGCKSLVAAQKALRQEQHGTKEVQGTPIDENKPLTISEMVSMVASEQGTDVLGGTEEVELPYETSREGR